MYTKSIDIYDHLYASKDYQKEARLVAELIKSRLPEAEALLDVACGTGRHLLHLKGQFKAEGLDVAPRFVEIAKKTNPDLELHVGDMTSFRLARRYDVITCLFSSIGYVRTTDRLFKAVRNMANHLTDRGLLVVEPWYAPENWHPRTVHATFVNEPELKIVRMSTCSTKGSLAVMDMHYLVGTPQSTTHFSELHQMGLFTEGQMVAALRSAGLETEHLPEGITGRGLYIARRLASESTP